jgi:2-keto-3-deoxy-L-rhamnonate aldolase RhmA
MLAEKLRQGEGVFGVMIRIVRNPAVVAIARGAGLDFLMVDMEHGAHSFETLSDLAVAARAEKVGLLVRVPELARGYVSRALDCGVEGVMVPMISSVEEARRFVGWAKYPPLGERGLASSAGHTGYTSPKNVTDMMQQMNRNTLAIAQMETRSAAENADGIAAVAGIDALLIGPNDLAVSLGKPGQLDCPEETAAIARIARAAAGAGKIFGMHAGADMLKRWTGDGLKLYMNSIDVTVLAAGFKSLREATLAPSSLPPA